jgi:outer membrane cobalamin receptor
VAYFSNTFKNAVDLQEGPPPLLVNRSKITGEGIETDVSFQARPDLYLSSHLTYVDTDIEGTGEELRNRPKWRGGFTALWRPFSSLVVNVETLYVGRSLDSSIPTGDRYLDAYTRANLAMTWSVSPKWRYSLAVDNLFNTDYEEAIGFPAPGISLRAGWQASF